MALEKAIMQFPLEIFEECDMYNVHLCKGPFANYVDNILTFFDHLPSCIDICYGINVDKKWNFWTTYLPRQH